MTNSHQPKPDTTAKTPASQDGKSGGELSDAALNQATGAMLACMPTDQLTAAHGTGGGGGAGKPAMGDGSVKTLIGL